MVQVERIQRRKERDEQRAAEKAAREKGSDVEEKKTVKIQDENQIQTLTHQINAAAAKRSQTDSHTIYDKKELEEMRTNQLKKEHHRASIIMKGMKGREGKE